MKEAVAIPVLGSGDLFSADDCLNMLRETGCDGVMIARGVLGAPWIFRQVAELAATGTFSAVTNLQRVEAMLQHLELFCRETGEAIAVREMKKHVGWYARGFPGAADIRRAANGTRCLEDLHTLMERIAAIPDEEHHAHT
jgi:tRNA-dihydrouridine synthase